MAIYRKALQRYSTAVEHASISSICVKGLDAGPQRYWASVIFTRLVALASNVLFICPESILNKDGLVWDFGSLAALIRGVFETILMIFYLGLDELSEDDWKLRINVVHLNDCTERIRLFYNLGSYEQLGGLIPTAVWLRDKVRTNPSYKSLSSQTQKDLLCGEKPTIFGKKQMIVRLGQNSDEVLSYYRFVSNYVHNFPFGFHRTGLHGRDGTINLVDITYYAQALDFGAQWLERVNKGFQQKFEGFTTFSAHARFDLSILRRRSPTLKADMALVDRVFGIRPT